MGATIPWHFAERGKFTHSGETVTGSLEMEAQTKAVSLCYNCLKEKRVTQIAAGFYHSVVLVHHVPTDDLADSLRLLLNNPEHSDVTFVVEGKQIFANRCILMARCEPLEKMVNGPMREGVENTIHIKDTSYDCFLAFLEFLYTEGVEALRSHEVDIDFALDLLGLADQFLVEPLKVLCEKAI